MEAIRELESIKEWVLLFVVLNCGNLTALCLCSNSTVALATVGCLINTHKAASVKGTMAIFLFSQQKKNYLLCSDKQALSALKDDLKELSKSVLLINCVTNNHYQ